ncbi:MAG TPA: arsenate reductase, partial [Alphaproteobacteria bacterium]|nr:arsenate reductase [Alphaproteobacteria bacterium]
TTWRELDETARQGEPVALLQAHPSLMKRPLIVQADGGSTVGWDAAARNALGLG